MYAKLIPCAGCGTKHASNEVCCERCWELVPGYLREAWVATKIAQPWKSITWVPGENAVLDEVTSWLADL